jgi:hypothetical protein
MGDAMLLNNAVLIAQILGTIAIIATFIIYWRQLVAMQSQVEAARDSSRSQNILALIDYIQRPEHRDARRLLFSLEGKDFTKWTTDERKHAEMACSAWDTVGLVLQNTSIAGAKDMITGNWRHSIFRCHALTAELKTVLREERDPDFWDDLDWLCEHAIDGYEAHGTSLRPKP